MKRFQPIFEKFETWINQGLYIPGDRLPAERKLAADMKVSRASIREAFLILEQKDLIEIRRGTKGGAYVKAPSPRCMTEGMDILLRMDKLTLDQVAEFREIIEVSVTFIAAQRADTKDIRLLKHHLEVAKSFVGRGSGWNDEFIKADKAIHICIAQISQNPLIVQALEATLNLGRYFNRFLQLNHILMEDNLHDLYDIVDAIENHQPSIASRITQVHIRRFNEAVV